MPTRKSTTGPLATPARATTADEAGKAVRRRSRCKNFRLRGLDSQSRVAESTQVHQEYNQHPLSPLRVADDLKGGTLSAAGRRPRLREAISSSECGAVT
jgi:hypothetical protein